MHHCIIIHSWHVVLYANKLFLEHKSCAGRERITFGNVLRTGKAANSTCSKQNTVEQYIKLVLQHSLSYSCSVRLEVIKIYLVVCIRQYALRYRHCTSSPHL